MRIKTLSWILFGFLLTFMGLPARAGAQGTAVVEDEVDEAPPPPPPKAQPESPPAEPSVKGPVGEPRAKKGTPKKAPVKENRTAAGAGGTAVVTPKKTTAPLKKETPDKAREENSDEVVVTGTKTKRLIKETPVRTEVISQKRMEAKVAKNVAQALENETGVTVEVSCGICNATAISLSGMPARFTLTLVDGMPLYSSLGTTYGLFGVPTALIDRIEVIKGPASALHGTDAIGGIVNIITKKPVRDFSSLDVRFGHIGSLDLHMVSSSRKQNLFGRGTSAGLIIFGSLARSPKLDRDGDGVSELAMQESALLGGNLYFYPMKNLEMMVRTTVLTAQLQCGPMGALLEAVNDFDPVNYLGRRALSETVLTQRAENALTVKYYFDQATLDFSLAHVFHKQDSDYEGEYYLARQHMIHSALQLHLPFGKRYSLVAGTSYRKELLSENLARTDYDYDIFGVYAEGSLKLGKWEWLHGARFSHHNEYGSVVTPRTALRFSPTRDLVVRGPVGTGFRAPTTFYEFFHGVHPGGYVIDMQADEPEQSVGIQFSLAWQPHKTLAFTMEVAQNIVSHAIGLTQNDDGTVISVFNAAEEFRVRSLEGKVEFHLHPFELQLGGSAVQIDDDAGVMSMATPTLGFTGAISWRRGPLSLDLSGRVVGPADLRKVYGYAYNPNSVEDPDELLDPETGANLGSLKRAKSPWWGLANFRARYKLADGLELYGEVENLLDFHQSDVEGNLMYPTDGPGGEAGPINVTYLWGPLKGRTFYLGAKITY